MYIKHTKICAILFLFDIDVMGTELGSTSEISCQIFHKGKTK